MRRRNLGDDTVGAARLTAQLEDIGSIRKIKRLQLLCGHYADAGQWAEIAALFGPEGGWTNRCRTVSGQVVISALLREIKGGGAERLAPNLLDLCRFLTSVITLAVEGVSARGRWYEVATTGGVRFRRIPDAQYAQRSIAPHYVSTSPDPSAVAGKAGFGLNWGLSGKV